MKRGPPNDFNIFHHGGRLFQQYCVDMYAKINQYSVNFKKNNQKLLQAEKYNIIQKALAENDTENLGHRYILPASHVGSPRWYSQKFQDAMAIVRHFRKPDLFITFTCNPYWKEIQDALLPGQSAYDRPDITSRIFRIKLNELIHDVTVKGVLGKAIAHVYTIEFQKRGLPHCHLLVIFAHDYKLYNNKGDFDRVVSAEIPDPIEQKELHDLVMKHMIHTPCDGTHPDKQQCIQNGCCKRNYPKEFQPLTVSNEDGYPLYMRKSPQQGGYTGIKHVKKFGHILKTLKIDNRWVVPYNAYLLWKYKAHINVEICCSIMAVKYLYKYLYKGPDRATIEFKIHKYNEIKQYIDSLYVSPSEACWKIFGFQLHDRAPTVIALPVHLPAEQYIYFENKATEQELQEKISKKDKTMLTEWMTNNERELLNPLSESQLQTDEKGNYYPAGPEIMYDEYPKYYRWFEGIKCWKKRVNIRQEDIIIGRIHMTSPGEGERHFLRRLLLRVCGATCWADIRTYKDKIHPDFRAACAARGLLHNDKEWHETLKEAAEYQTGYALRSLFALIVRKCEVSNCKELWGKNCDKLSDDILYNIRKLTGKKNLQLSDYEIHQHALIDIEKNLKQFEKSLEFYGLPSITISRSLYQQTFHEKIYDSETCKKQVADATFNHEQKTFYKAVTSAIYSEQVLAEDKIFFLDALGGTGKTWLMGIILAFVRGHPNHIALAVAFSGIAALLLEGGSTINSKFDIPIKIYADTITKIKRKNSSKAEIIKQAKIIVIDEAPMASKQILECLDRSVRYICDIKKPFAGKTVILTGDFRQILPVIKGASRSQIISSTLNKSYIWNYAQKNLYHLSLNERVKRNCEDQHDEKSLQHFADTLQSIGDGTYPICKELGEDMIKLPNSWISKSKTIEEFIDEIFPNLTDNYLDHYWFAERAILTPTNLQVHKINNIALQKLPGKIMTFISDDRNIDLTSSSLLYPEELLNKIDTPELPPHKLILKKNAIIMTLRNLDKKAGVCNGTRLKIIDFRKHVIYALILTGPGKGNTYLIPRIKLKSTSESPIYFSRLQFPVKLAIAMTINKAQGQTLQKMGLYLNEPVFSHGQLYVACGRVGSSEKLSILVVNGRQQGKFKNFEGTYTRNVVWEEVFSNLNHTKSNLNLDDYSNNQHLENKMNDTDLIDNSTRTYFCDCGASLIHVQNNKRSPNIYKHYYCDVCDRKIKKSEMVYHCSKYTIHNKDYCTKCIANYDKMEMDC